MAITIRGGTPLVVATIANPVSGTLTGTRQPQAGDLLLIFHFNDFYAATAMPTPTVGGSTSGVTAITNGAADAGTNQAHIKAYTYVVGSTGDLTVSVTESAPGDEDKGLVVYVLAGADTATPIDGGSSGAAGAFSATGQASQPAPAVTPSGTDALLIVHDNAGGGSSTTSYTSPSSPFSELYDANATGGMSYVGGTEQLATSGSTGTRTFTAANAVPWAAVSIAIKTAAAASAVPYNPQRTIQARDPGEAWWLQRDRSNAHLVATAANPVPAPLDTAYQAGGRYWHLYNDLAYRFTFVPYAQRDRRDANTAGSAPPAAVLPAPQRTVPVRDYGEAQWWSQNSRRDPALLTAAQLENELLGGADTARHLAWFTDRRLVPQQPPRLADQSTAPAVDLDPTLAGLPARRVAYNLPSTHVDRREVPQQRPYISDPSSYPTVPPTDPLTVAWGAGGTYWLLYNSAALQVSRRLVPQQRDYKSDPALLLTALLENELLGSADDLRRRYLQAAYYDDRREVPQQRTAFALGAPDADPLLLVDGIRRAYLTPAYWDRREVPQQPQRETLYFDAGPDVPPLTLAFGAGGMYWHLYNRPSRSRPGWPLCYAVPVNQMLGTRSEPGLLTSGSTAGGGVASTVTGGRLTSATVPAASVTNAIWP